VTACLVLKEKSEKRPQLDPMELKSFLKAHLTPFKVPKGYIVLEELPKGSTGKILKRELKKQIVEMLKKETL